MDPRKLKRLLDTYRDAGVSEVHLSADLQPTRVVFGPTLQPVPTEDVDMADTKWADGAPLGLTQALDRIRKAYEQKPRAS